MRATLKKMEQEVLEEGRELTRQRLQERMQKEADAIPAACAQSGLILKRQSQIRFTLMTVSGVVEIKAIRGYSTATESWVCPVREQWGLAHWARLSPEFEERLTYTVTQTGSFEKAAELAGRWNSPISDDALHALVQRVGKRSQRIELPAPPPKPKEAPFSLVIMIDGWMVRERGTDWGAAPPGSSDQQRVAWREVKSAVIYRLEARAENASGRGMLIEKKVVAAPPGTDVTDLGAMIQKEAIRCGSPRAIEIFVVADGAIWIWNLIEDRFASATKTLDFYHGSQHLWALAHHLHPNCPDQAKAWIGPLLHQLRHNPNHGVINTLEEILAQNPSDAAIIREVNYFQNHRDHLHYANLADQNAPIGSGSMESTCSQFQDRLKRRGQFWSPQGLANLLSLDAIAKNKTLPHLWN